MINYVIINGVNSNTKNGLGINELPPITKPSMRTQTEEIDGRDGDIITKLGYSAYDKTITIGLFGTGYDVNDIISFFTSEGTITFSNEPDKYYKFTMLEQIDVESLLRFKTASITFHCQPFKYPSTETPLEIEYDYIEQTGETLTLNNTGESILDLSLKGNTSQDTTTGKNLLPITASSYSYGGITTILNEDGSISVSGTATGTSAYLMDTANVNLPAGTYTLSIGNTAPKNIRLIYSQGTMTVYSGNTETNATTTQTITTCRLLMFTTQGETYNFTIKPMLESGSSATSFEPYTNGASPNPSYPQPINVVSGDNEVVVCGVNLFDKSRSVNSSFESSIQTALQNYINNNVYAKGYIDRNSTLQNNASFITAFIPCRSEETYTIYNNYKKIYPSSNANLSCIKFLDEDGNVISSSSEWVNTAYTHTTANNEKWIMIGVKTNDNGVDYRDYLQVEVGSSATDLVSYTSQTYPINLGELELCKIGDYQDYFTKNSDGQWCKYNAIGKVVLDGSESWSVAGTSTSGKYRMQLQLSNIKGSSSASETSQLFSDKYTAKSPSDTYSLIQGMSITPQGYINLYDNNYNSSSASGYKTWLSSNNVNLYAPLITPYLSLIEDETLISQLDTLESAMSYEGQTNVMQVNDDKPFIIDAKALEQGSDEVVVNNIGNATSKPLIALEGTGNINIYLDGTQVLQANVEDKMNIDIDKLEAYNPDTSALLNRQVTGNYNSMTLPSGNSTIKIDGNLTSATITNYTRWL